MPKMLISYSSKSTASKMCSKNTCYNYYRYFYFLCLFWYLLHPYMK